jgi:hypothetical protein
MLIYIHLPKTGGSTLRDLLHWNYNDQSYQISAFEKIPVLIQLSDSAKAQIQCLQGQIFYGIHQYFPTKDFSYTTILRHPVKRVVSQYHYISKRQEHIGQKPSNVSIDEFLDDEPFQAWTQVNLLAGGDTIDTALRRPVSEALLQQAIANIEKDFPVVGVVEKYDEGLLLMKRHYQWKRGYYKRKNENQGYIPIEGYPEATQKRIWQMCEPEIELYNYACRRLEQQLAQQPADFWDELKQMQQMSRRFSRMYDMLQPFQRTRLWSLFRKTARQIGL